MHIGAFYCQMRQGFVFVAAVALARAGEKQVRVQTGGRVSALSVHCIYSLSLKGNQTSDTWRVLLTHGENC